MTRAFRFYAMVIPVSLLLAAGSATAADQPLARIAVISNPYITTLPAAEIKDETGSLRDFLAKTGPDSMAKTVSLVNSLRPDAFVVLGSLTWSGSDADFDAFAEFFNQINVPKFTVPGHRDRLSGSLDGYQRVFGKYDAQDNLRTVEGVHLGFTSDLHDDPDAATGRLDDQLAKAGRANAVLLFDEVNRTMGRSKLTPTHEKFWSLVERHHVAAKFSPTRYGHALGYVNTLPTWTVGSTGWSTRGAITLINVFADRVEMAEVSDPSSAEFSLAIPNPITSPRMLPAENDPFGCPSFTEDLKQKPDFSFALISDPQFDRETNRATLISRAEATIRDLNQLNPAFVLIAGDLVNNNLPEEWEMFNQIFAELKPPKHVVPGNHDVLFNYDFIEASYSSAPEQKPEYAKIVKQALADAAKEGFTGPAALYEKYTGVKPRQLIEHGDCAFITVPFLTMRADAEQIEFLKEQLERSKDKKHVFVVAHYPSLSAFGNNVQPQLGGTEVLSLLHEHRVTGYLFGHRHRNGFRMHERTAHVLSDNCGTIHLLHVFPDRVVVGRKTVGAPLYEKLTIPSPRG
jgi:predicted phosphohydrolase